MHDDVACIYLLCLQQICKKTAERTELQASATEERTVLLLADSPFKKSSTIVGAIASH
jgi:hypothetical protein